MHFQCSWIDLQGHIVVTLVGGWGQKESYPYYVENTDIFIGVQWANKEVSLTRTVNFVYFELATAKEGIIFTRRQS